MDVITPKDRPHSRWSRRPARSALYVAVVIAAIALLAVMINVTTGGSPSHPSAEAAGAPPGNRDVQRWLKAREKAQIELNDALVPVVQNRIGSAGPNSAECRRLNAAVLALKAQGRAPVAEIDELARAGLDKIEQAAAACLAGDVASTQRLAAEGLAERADASLPLDEAMEGE